MFTPADHTFAVCAYKESPYLEDCVLSLLSQDVPTNVIIATSTPNEYIDGIAKKYNLPVFINNGKTGIGPDWNFAVSCVKTKLVTIAHQDDLYFQKYTKVMFEYLNSAKDPIIFFSHYAEIRNSRTVTNNKLLSVKKKLLTPLKPKFARGSKFIRRRALSLGNCICCPAVTYVTEIIKENPFSTNYKSNIDWEMWEKLSKLNGSFLYSPQVLMGHRVHEGSTTSELIEDNTRTKEDLDMLCKFWPEGIAKIIAKKYNEGQKSNELNEQDEVNE